MFSGHLYYLDCMDEIDYNNQILDQVIIGRVSPKIYAFETNSFPNFLKIGDTYRSVSTRLREWKRLFPDLSQIYEREAIVNDNVYFRDHAVHAYLTGSLRKHRLQAHEAKGSEVFSNEFFESTSKRDIDEAIEDIKASFEVGDQRYEFYDATDLRPEILQFRRGETWPVRPNQIATVKAFKDALAHGRNNLLMYAVMRFGKSFVAILCAQASSSRVVLVVSAKKDVKTEWRHTVEVPGNFADFRFVDSKVLDRDSKAISAALAEGVSVVVFVTFQELLGEEVRKRHQELFANKIDLLIIDETHFGARGEEFSKVIDQTKTIFGAKAAKEEERATRGAAADLSEVAIQSVLKKFDAKVRLHLSGTPYRLLMSEEFRKEDIISTVRYADVIAEQKAWEDENLIDEKLEEWDNPYFGFPQMIRFAFHPNISARKKMAELRSQGTTFAFSALLEPRSIVLAPENKAHRQFRHQQEVLDLLLTIDGSQRDDELLGFLDFDQIKEGKMCRHMVMVLPYRASCDAMEELISKNRDSFKNLADYEIINISGLDSPKHLSEPEDVKSAIRSAELINRKTLTLTVNRMLTGSTVEQWDTMLFLKDTSSPQEYDQAIFRLQNKYVRSLKNSNKFIIENLKPQTLLVDFAPERMFRIQEQGAFTFNLINQQKGNAALHARIDEELRISPVIAMNAGRLRQVEATDILEAVSEYKSTRSISDEARDIPVDLGLLGNPAIAKEIRGQAPIGSKQGLTVDPVQGDGEDFEHPQSNEGENKAPRDAGKNGNTLRDDDLKAIQEKIQTYYQRILFFAMLTPNHVGSLDDIIVSLDDATNRRIAKNLSLDLEVLKLIPSVINPLKLWVMDYKIQNSSTLMRDPTLTPLDRAIAGLRKFERISDSEIRTPSWLCQQMVDELPVQSLRSAVEGRRLFLDVASKSAEFAVALYGRLINEAGMAHERVKDLIISIPTSAIAYEFTRKLYEVLDLEVSAIPFGIFSGDLIDGGFDLHMLKNDEGAEDSSKMAKFLRHQSRVADDGKESVKFGAIVGNPPYQIKGGGGGANDTALYHLFVEQAMALEPNLISMVIPSRWMSSGRGLEKFREAMLSSRNLRKMVDYPDGAEIFPSVQNKGGICVFLWDRDYDGTCQLELVRNGRSLGPVGRALNEFDVLVRDYRAVPILKKVIASSSESVIRIASADTPFGLASNFPRWNATMRDPGQLKYFHLAKSKRQWSYIDRVEIKKNEADIGGWKVFVPLAGSDGGRTLPDQVLGSPEIAPPQSVCSQTFRYFGPFANEAEAKSFESYFKTKLFRFLVSLRKNSHNSYRDSYLWVPMQTWDRVWTDGELYKNLNINSEEQDFISSMIKDMND